VIDDNNLEYVKESEIFKELGSYKHETIRAKRVMLISTKSTSCIQRCEWRATGETSGSYEIEVKCGSKTI
jgi:hypothetical protein